MFYCPQCKKFYPEDAILWRCSCGSPFEYISNNRPYFPKKIISRRDNNIWRYLEAIPSIRKENIITLGEGMSPLIPVLFADNFNVLFKLDFIAPTLSFKDRGTSLLVSKLKENNIKEVIEDSSGNAGASLSAYCAYASIKCNIYVPAYTSIGKLLQIEMYGAKAIKVAGTREETSHATIEAANNSFYASHNWNPFFLEGIKTIAFEIWEQLNWKAPDNIIVPAGQGSLVLGCYQGFRELQAAGEIEKIPHIFAIQSANCAPLFEAFQKKFKKPAIIQKKETVAEGISSAFPVRGSKVLEAVRETNGKFLAVSENEIINSHREIAKKGIFIELTSAVAVAGLLKMIESNLINHSELTVTILTGSGLKSVKKNY